MLSEKASQINKNYYKSVINEPLHGRMLRCANAFSPKDKEILDIGCSYGWLEKACIEKECKKIVGIDPDIHKVELCKENIPLGFFFQGSAGKLDFEDNSFDIVTLYEVIEHVDKNSEPLVFGEIARVLKAGGSLVLSTPFKNIWACLLDPAWYFGHRHYSREELENFLSSAGLKITDISFGGGFWELIGMLNLYFSKWVLRRELLFKKFFDDNRNKEFVKDSGFSTIFVTAVKPL